MDRPPFEHYLAHHRFLAVAEPTPDGRRVLVSTNRSGQFNLWAVGIDGGEPEQLTSFEDNSVRAVAVRADGTVLFAADRDGDEFTQLYRLPPGGPAEQLTDLAQVQHAITPAAWAPDGRSFAFSANSRTPTDGEVFVWTEGEPEPRYLFGEGMYAFPVSFSPDGSLLLAAEFRSNTDVSLWTIDIASGEATERTPHEGEVKYFPGPWKHDGSGFFVVSDAGREFSGLAFKPLDGQLEWVAAPDRDVEEVAGSRDGRVIAWIENDDGWASLHVRDLERGVDLPAPTLPAGTISVFGSGLALSADGARLALVWEQPVRPGEVVVVDTATGESRAVTESREPDLRRLELRAPELVRYESFDGRRIPAWLYRPGGGDAPAAFALLIHGGPEAQEKPIYRSYVQYLLSRGIGVLATNIRGSTGYGKTYQKLIHHDWGGGDLEDWRHAAEWLRAQPFVDGDRLGVFGGSYGGFATLTCVTRLPEYWRAAVDIFGPSNLLTFVRAVPPQWLRFMAEWVGDPDTEEEYLRERSPIAHVEDVRAAMLVIQGAKDPRVVQSESDQMVERLRELGRDVEYVVFEDEGHGFTRHANEVRAYKLTCEWLESHLA